jgi:monoamine oxidase
MAAAADALAEPFGRVLFAGEAASSKPATVLGAYLSGKREAERLLQLLQQPSSKTGSTAAAVVNATSGPL